MLNPEQQSSLGTAAFLIILIGVAFAAAYNGGSSDIAGCTSAQNIPAAQNQNQQAKPGSNDQPAPMATAPLNNPKPNSEQQKSGDCTGNSDENRKMIKSTASIARWTLRLAMITAVLGAAAIWTAVIARQTARHQLRAYVGNEKIELECPNLTNPAYVPMDPNTPGYFADFILLTVKNYGETPANNVSTWANQLTVPVPFKLSEDYIFKPYDPTLHPGRTITKRSLFPGQTYISKIGLYNISPIIDAVAHKVSLYIYGQISYTDIYGRGQTSRFCYIYEPWRPVGDQFTAHARYNEAD